MLNVYILTYINVSVIKRQVYVSIIFRLLLSDTLTFNINYMFGLLL